MKPFNLEEAKAGKPIVTRDGKAVKFVAHIPEAREGHKVAVLKYGRLFPYYENGRYLAQGALMETESGRDLFMAQAKRGAWVNLYAADTDSKRTLGALHATKENALQALRPAAIATIYIEWEE